MTDAATTSFSKNSAPRKRKLVAILVAIVIAFLGLFLLFVALTADEGPFDDSGLDLPPFQAIAKAKNSYTALEAAAAAIVTTGFAEDADGLAGSCWEVWTGGSPAQGSPAFKTAARFLQANGQALQLLDGALARPLYQAAESPTGLGVAAWPGEVAGILKLRAMHRFLNGSDSAGLEDALNFIELGRRLQDGSRSHSEKGIGAALYSEGHSLLIDMVPRATLSSSKARELLDRHRNMSPSFLAFANVIRAEYQFMTNSFKNESIPIQYRLTFKKNKTLRGLCEAYAHCIDVLAQPYSEQQLGHPVPSEEVLGLISRFFRNNTDGELLITMAGELLQQAVMSHCRSLAVHRLTRCMLALKCFHLDKGRMPSALSELVPEYLDVVPADPYDGRPIRYSGKGRLYCVGNDLADDGGTLNMFDRNEPTLNLKFGHN